MIYIMYMYTIYNIYNIFLQRFEALFTERRVVIVDIRCLIFNPPRQIPIVSRQVLLSKLPHADTYMAV